MKSLHIFFPKRKIDQKKGNITIPSPLSRDPFLTKSWNNEGINVHLSWNCYTGSQTTQPIDRSVSLHGNDGGPEAT